MRLPEKADPGDGDQRAATAEGGRTSLDQSTQLGRRASAVDGGSGWRFTSWAGCCEASLVWVIGPSGMDQVVEFESTDGAEGGGNRRHLIRVSVDGEILSEWDEDPELAAARRWRQSNGRAASSSRRYFVTNQLRYMWVLTFRDEHWDRRSVMRDVSEFARRLRSERASKAFPYWYSPELHPGGHGWHVNFFIAERVPHRLVEQVWSHGFVYVTDFATAPRAPRGEPLGLCPTPRDGWRRASRYGCKYSQKDWSPEHVGRTSHRYEVAQHFQPTRVRHWVRDRADAESLVKLLVPEDARQRLKVWDSNDARDWSGPPVRTWKW